MQEQEKLKVSHRGNRLYLHPFIVISAALLFLGSAVAYASTSQFEDMKQNIMQRVRPAEQQIPTPTPWVWRPRIQGYQAPTPSSAPSATISPTPSPVVSPKAVNKINQPIDQDPPVHCNVNINCGGGTTPLKKSECDASTCCGLNDGTWKLMSKTECDRIHSNNNAPVIDNSYNTGSGSNAYISPTYTPYPTFVPQAPAGETGLTDQQKLELASICYGEAWDAYNAGLRDLYGQSRSENLGLSALEIGKSDLLKKQARAIATCKVLYDQP